MEAQGRPTRKIRCAICRHEAADRAALADHLRSHSDISNRYPKPIVKHEENEEKPENPLEENGEVFEALVAAVAEVSPEPTVAPPTPFRIDIAKKEDKEVSSGKQRKETGRNAARSRGRPPKQEQKPEIILERNTPPREPRVFEPEVRRGTGHNQRKYVMVPCPICNKSFMGRANMEIHYRIHMPEWFKCSHCAFKTKFAGSLQRHQSRHYSRPLKCPMCDYLGVQARDMRAHMQSVHLGGALFSCDQCDYKNNDRSNLKRHIRTKHATPETGEIYRCEQCKYQTPRKERYHAHVAKEHTGIKNFACPTCKFSTTSNELLRRHISRQHERNGASKAQATKPKALKAKAPKAKITSTTTTAASTNSAIKE